VKVLKTETVRATGESSTIFQKKTQDNVEYLLLARVVLRKPAVDHPASSCLVDTVINLNVLRHSLGTKLLNNNKPQAIVRSNYVVVGRYINEFVKNGEEECIP